MMLLSITSHVMISYRPSNDYGSSKSIQINLCPDFLFDYQTYHVNSCHSGIDHRRIPHPKSIHFSSRICPLPPFFHRPTMAVVVALFLSPILIVCCCCFR